MANGNGNGKLTPIKTLALCLSVTVAVNSLSFSWSRQVSEQIDHLRDDMERKTDQRYRQTDAQRDFRLVEYRFSRNEENIRRCIEHISGHEHPEDEK